MTYVWFGLGLSLLLAIGTIIFTGRPQQNEYKESEHAGPSGSRKRNRSKSPADRDRSCVICLTDIENPQKEFLPCFHYFHSDCIKTLINYDRHCPICRTPF